MRKEHYGMIFLAVVGALVISGFVKSKVCQDRKTGDLKPRPWYWPCGSNSDAIVSASTD